MGLIQVFSSVTPLVTVVGVVLLFQTLTMAAKKKQKNKKPKLNTEKKSIVSNVSISQQQDLPHEIIMDILSRLPVESLLRFRCVSKNWCKMIFDSFFVNLHSQREQPSDIGFIFYKSPHICFNNYARNDKKDHWYELNQELSTEGLELHCSCNGLLLISCWKPVTMYMPFSRLLVYNPITRNSVLLPSMTNNMVWIGKVLFSLVYDSFTTTYKAVCSGYTTSNGYASRIVTVGVEGDSWRDVVVPKPHHLREYPPVFANGSLHYMLDSRDVEDLEMTFFIEMESEGKILTLDVTREMFFTIPHPECNSGVHTLLETRGELCFVDHVSNTKLKFWVLKNLEMHEWIVEHSIDVSGIERVPFKGFLEDSYPFGITINSKRKIIIKCYDILKGVTLFFSYELDLNQLNSETGLGFSWSPEAPEFEQKYFPLKHVNSIVSFE